MASDTDTERWNRVWAHRDALERIARRRTRSSDDAHDLVVETMLRAFVNPHVDLDRAGAWMTRVLCNLCIDHHRASASPQVMWRLGCLDAAWVPSHEDDVCDHLLAARMYRDMNAMPPTHRAVLELRAEGRNVAEIAGVLGVTYKSAESSLSRARSALRDKVGLGIAPVLTLLRRRVWSAATASVAAAAASATLVAVPAVPAKAPVAAPPTATSRVHVPDAGARLAGRSRPAREANAFVAPRRASRSAVRVARVPVKPPPRRSPSLLVIAPGTPLRSEVSRVVATVEGVVLRPLP